MRNCAFYKNETATYYVDRHGRVWHLPLYVTEVTRRVAVHAAALPSDAKDLGVNVATETLPLDALDTARRCDARALLPTHVGLPKKSG